jgi:hypothetical protein
MTIREVIEKALERPNGTPARDIYLLLLGVVIENGPGNNGLTWAYLREAHAALTSIMEAIEHRNDHRTGKEPEDGN